MIKPFNELVKVDISKYLVKKPNFIWDKIKKEFVIKGYFNYLNWAKGLELLYEFGAEDVQFKPIKNELGHSVFYNKELGGLGCPEIRLWIKIDEKESEITYPLIRGSKVLDKIDQLDIEVARQRAFTKGIAIMTGLGLSEWIKTDEEIDKNKDDQMQDTESELELQRTNTQNKYIEVAKMLGGADKLNKSIELSKVELEKLFKSNVIQDLKDLETKITIASTNAK
jgi:hypothetical protein